MRVLLLVSFLASCVGIKNTANKHKLTSMINKSPYLSKHFVGFGLYDPIENKYLYAKNTGQLFTPASNMKLYTLYASLKTLEDTVWSLRYSQFNDTLVISGVGDPTILHPDFQYQPALDFLNEVSDSVIIILNEPNSPARYGPGWAWDDFPYDFQPEMSSLPIHGNFVTIEAGDSNHLKTVPPVFAGLVEINGLEKRSYERDELFNYFTVSPSSKGYELPFKTSAKLAAQILGDTLHRKIYFSTDTSFSLSELIHSYHLDSLLIPMLHKSDNHIAEQLLLQCAYRTGFNWNTRLYTNHLLKNDLALLPHDLRWVDGSGLSRYNLVTPGDNIALLHALLKEVGKERLLQLLPAGGLNGTISSWYKGEEPYVYAKTGTLSNNHNISGILLTKSGKTLIFSFMNNHYINDLNKIKNEMQVIFKYVRDRY